MVQGSSDRAENNGGKGENAGYQHFLLFPTMFSKVFFPRDCLVKDIFCSGISATIRHMRKEMLPAISLSIVYFLESPY